MSINKLMQLIIALSVFSFSVTAPQAAEDFAPQAIAKSERCPVCGMYPANYPKWHAQIVFKDGTHSSFDSAAEMFRFLLDMARFDKKHGADDIGKIYVTAYEKGGWLDARQAFFVAGSQARGPMGSDLPAFASKEEATRFSQMSGGKTYSFDQVTPTILNGGEHGHAHGDHGHSH